MWSFTAAIIFAVFGFLHAYPYDYGREYAIAQLQNYDQFIVYRCVVDPLMGEGYFRPGRGFDSMNIGNSFGVAKRGHPRNNMKNQQHRRTFDSLVPGNGFGRTSKRAFDPLGFDNSIEYGEPEKASMDISEMKRTNLDSLRMGSFGTAKRTTETEQDEKAFMKPSESIIQELDGHKQGSYLLPLVNYSKFPQHYFNHNTEN